MVWECITLVSSSLCDAARSDAGRRYFARRHCRRRAATAARKPSRRGERVAGGISVQSWGEMKFLASLECGMSFLFCQGRRLYSAENNSLKEQSFRVLRRDFPNIMSE